MDDRRIQPVIQEIRLRHGRPYAEAAYYFVLEALDYAVYLLGRKGETRHISVQELLDGIRRFAAEEFGPLAPYAFRSWGVRSTADFGDIVFQMVEAGLLKKDDRDRLEDFQDGFDFQEAFAAIGTITV